MCLGSPAGGQDGRGQQMAEHPPPTPLPWHASATAVGQRLLQLIAVNNCWGLLARLGDSDPRLRPFTTGTSSFQTLC